jgi:nitroimidazol reductase NimA-like FMN-containing flavoprotein (pyridoxamine 5'-phosphate oxidase superfamily)
MAKNVGAIRVDTRELTSVACEALLAKHHVGSMALAFHDRVTIALSNYVYADHWIYGRMEHGPDLAALRHHQWVAFEVSEIDGIYDWRTVTAHGSVQFLSDTESSARGAGEFAEALARLRSAVPAVFTPRDPMPQRVQLFRLHVDELVGRETRSNAHDSLPPP